MLVEGEEVILSDYSPTRCEQQYEIRVQKTEARDNQICNPPPDHCHHISINLPLEKKKKSTELQEQTYLFIKIIFSTF